MNSATRTLAIALLVIGLASCRYSQEIRRNPEKPLNPNAGRTLELQKVWETDESSGGFSLVRARTLLADSRGFVYVLDFDFVREGQTTTHARLLKFSPDGVFAGTLTDFEYPLTVSANEHPRYARSTYAQPTVAIWRDEPIICAGTGKIYHFGKDGQLVRNLSLPVGRYYEILGAINKGYVVMAHTRDVRPADGTKGFRQGMTEIICVSFDGTSSESIIQFPARDFVSDRLVYPEQRFSAALGPSGKAVYVSHTDEYMITKIEFARPGVAAKFTRQYPRIRAPRPGPGTPLEDMPEIEYWYDIARLYIADKNLWVLTSWHPVDQRPNLEGDRERMFDVFDPKGAFVDSFFIGRGVRVPADGGLLYAIFAHGEKRFIGKYRIVNGPKPFSRP